MDSADLAEMDNFHSTEFAENRKFRKFRFGGSCGKILFPYMLYVMLFAMLSAMLYAVLYAMLYAIPYAMLYEVCVPRCAQRYKYKGTMNEYNAPRQ